MSYRGDIRLGDTIDIKFCTTAASTGAPTTLSGTPAISAYPANSTTQITAGITLTADFDAVTGLNNVRVVASSGNGYATATNYDLVITTGTVGGTSAVGYVIGSFSIENRSALMPTTAARTLDVASTGEAGLDFANVNIPAGAIPTLGIIDNGTAQSATGTTLVLRSAAAFADSELIGATIVITGGSAGVGQSRVITAYTGATDTATVDTWTTTPTGTITYVIFAGSPASTSLVPNVNVTQISGDTTAADNLEAALDGTGGVNLSLAAVNITAGMSITQSTANADALVVTGNGTGNGASFKSGTGATGQGINITSQATNGSALVCTAAGTGTGFSASGGTSGKGALFAAGATGTAGLAVTGGGTSGAGITVTTTSGDAIQAIATAGNGLTVTANGTSKHGAVITGGTAGTSDGLKCVAGTGGVDIRGAVTGNITGNVSGSVGSVTADVNADVKKINAVTVIGAGTSGDKWRA